MGAETSWEVVPPFGVCVVPCVDLAAVSDVSRETPPPPTPEELAFRRMRRLLGLTDAAPLAPPATTRLVAVANQKGGVGKTTTAVNLAVALALLGQEVLVVDLDPQGNASTALDLPHDPGTPGAYEVLVAGQSLADSVRPVAGVPGLWGVPATVDLAGAEIELVSQVAREARLRRALRSYLVEHEQAHRRLDYVVIDCPPSLGLLTLNALVAVDEVLIPLQSEYYALEGLGHLLGTVGLVAEHLNPELRITGILLTMYDARTKLAPQVADEVRTHFPERLMAVSIPRSVRVSEAPSYGQSVLQYDPGSPGAGAYLRAAREFAGEPVDAGEAEAAPMGGASDEPVDEMTNHTDVIDLSTGDPQVVGDGDDAHRV